MDEKHDPLLLEDVVAEKASTLGKDERLEVAPTEQGECHCRSGRIDAKEGDHAVT
jgi:hypothetical protein